MTTFGFIPVASILQDESTFPDIIGTYTADLQQRGGQQWREADLTRAEPLFYFVVTGGTERQILTLREKRRQHAPDEPVYLIAHPGNNSLPAALEVLARLQQDGEAGRIFYLGRESRAATLRDIVAAVHNVTVRRALRGMRVGLVGDPSDWLVASSPDAETVRQTWGPQVVPVDLETLIQAIPNVAEGEIRPLVAQLRAGAAEVREPTSADVADVVRVYLALKQIVTERRLDALTLRCFDLVTRLHTTGCYALARLNDEGIIAGCEGDLVSTLGMMWTQQLLGAVPWMANPAQVNESTNTLWVAHCTVPLKRVNGYRLRSHFESGLGLGIQGDLPLGPVTLLRIGGRQLKQLWLAEGDLVRDGYAENLCRTQAEIRLTKGHVGDLLRAPLGNHLIIVPGHHAARLRLWWQMAIA